LAPRGRPAEAAQPRYVRSVRRALRAREPRPTAIIARHRSLIERGGLMRCSKQHRESRRRANRRRVRTRDRRCEGRMYLRKDESLGSGRAACLQCIAAKMLRKEMLS
jgi:hypothetical protein